MRPKWFTRRAFCRLRDMFGHPRGLIRAKARSKGFARETYSTRSRISSNFSLFTNCFSYSIMVSRAARIEETINNGGAYDGHVENRTVYPAFTESCRHDAERAGREVEYLFPGCLKMGKRSFPKLKIPHQSHADFCSTDTAGGLDNKKRRYAPRGGVAYRLFLWGFPKGATPPFGTRLCEAKCSVLYALPALP